MHHKGRLRQRKLAELSKLCQAYAIVIICEVHGSEQEILHALKAFKRSFDISVSLCSVGGEVKRDTGGIVALTHHDLLSGGQTDPIYRKPIFSHIVPGRAVCVEVKGPLPGQVLSTVGAHNHGFTNRDMANFEKFVKDRSAQAVSRPDLYGFNLVGDFNLAPHRRR